jgi:hypothetical protein
MASKFFKEVVSWGIKKLPRSKKVSPDITSIKPGSLKKKKKSWKDYIDTSNPSFKKHWPPGD